MSRIPVFAVLFCASAHTAATQKCAESLSCAEDVSDTSALMQNKVETASHDNGGLTHELRGCSQCSSPDNCYVSTWGAPCFQAGSYEQCTNDFSGEWCETIPPPAPPTPAPVPVPVPGPPGACIGDPEVDAILLKSDIGVAAGIEGSGIYQWSGFCAAAQELEQTGYSLYKGTGTGENRVAQVLVNIASFLAQSKQETGDYLNCDEANYRGTETAPCTQRSDGQRYDTLTGPPACTVDMNMHMVAETSASWAASNPKMQCVPGTATAGCCWWGRGSIQTTGPHNYKMLQLNVVAKIDSLKDNVDLCSNPEAICQEEKLKWLGGLYYWTSVVQEGQYFEQSLHKYVNSGFDSASSIMGGSSFNDGCGGLVNNGFWSAHAHESYRRNQYFDEHIAAFKSAGMGDNMPTMAPAPPPPPPGCGLCTAQGERCFVGTWAAPCFTPVNGQSECSHYGGEWCDAAPPTVAPVPAPPGVPSAGCASCLALSKPQSCYVSGWTVPCFIPPDATECEQHYKGEWCSSPIAADDEEDET